MKNETRLRSVAHSSLQRMMVGKERPGRRLMYFHSVHPSLPRSHRPDHFRRQLELMLGMGLEFKTQSQVPEVLAHAAPKAWISIGFDDGYEDNHSVVLPILSEYRIRATFYVVAGAIAEKSLPAPSGYHLYEGYEMMAASQIRELASEGHEIASHGLHHELATQVLKSERDLTAELCTSRDVLSDMSGTDVTSHSYPNGQRGAFSRETIQAVGGAGFSTSATTVWGRVSKRCDPLCLPRCELSNRDTLRDVEEKLTGRRDYLWAIHRMRRRPTW